MESGIDVHVIKYDSNAIKESLAPAIYNIKLPPIGSPYLQINASGIQIPEKVYGNVNSKIHQNLSRKSRPLGREWIEPLF